MTTRPLRPAAFADRPKYSRVVIVHVLAVLDVQQAVGTAGKGETKPLDRCHRLHHSDRVRRIRVNLGSPSGQRAAKMARHWLPLELCSSG